MECVERTVATRERGSWSHVISKGNQLAHHFTQRGSHVFASKTKPILGQKSDTDPKMFFRRFFFRSWRLLVRCTGTVSYCQYAGAGRDGAGSTQAQYSSKGTRGGEGNERSRVRTEVARRRGNKREASLDVLGQKSDTLPKMFFRRFFSLTTTPVRNSKEQ